MGQSFFAPELVMQHKEAIGLSAEQKDYLKTEIRAAQLKFTEWQWKLQDEMEELVALAKQPLRRRAAGSCAIGKVLATERGIKRPASDLLVRIKNKLTPRAASKALRPAEPSQPASNRDRHNLVPQDPPTLRPHLQELPTNTNDCSG